MYAAYIGTCVLTYILTHLCMLHMFVCIHTHNQTVYQSIHFLGIRAAFVIWTQMLIKQKGKTEERLD